MNVRRIDLRLLLAVSTVATATITHAKEPPPVHVERLSERAVLVRAGTRYFDQVAALATERGLVVIDTGIAPTLAREYRKKIEQAFGRSDFAYVINTHYHYDHTNGNQVFPEAQVVGHELCLQGMRRFGSRLESFITSQKARVPGWERRLASLAPDSEDAVGLRDTMSHWSRMIEDLETPGRFTLTPPTITFGDRMTLDMGDVTLRLIHYGEGAHTGDDTLVHVPEEKLLFSGDLLWSGGVSLAFQSQIEPQRWLEALGWVLDEPDTVDRVVTTHNGLMDGEQLLLRRRYLADALQGLQDAKETGLGFEAAADRLSVEKAFGYLEESGLETEELRRQHATGLRMLWRHLSDTRSVAEVLETTLDASGLDACRETLREIESAAADAYYFDEPELNRLGYRLLGRGKVDAAVFVFETNAGRFPESGNVHDSLGEAYLAAGNESQAIASYRRSLELTPDNDSAKQALERLGAER